MSLPEVRIATGEEDKEKVINAFVIGFAADPVMRWLWPDARGYLEAMPRFSTAFGGKAFEHDTAHLVNDGKAAATWLPPGEDVDPDPVVNVMTDTLPPDRLEDMLSVLEQMDTYHPHDCLLYTSPSPRDS